MFVCFTKGQGVGVNSTHQSNEGHSGGLWVYARARREDKGTERIDATC